MPRSNERRGEYMAEVVGWEVTRGQQLKLVVQKSISGTPVGEPVEAIVPAMVGKLREEGIVLKGIGRVLPWESLSTGDKDPVVVLTSRDGLPTVKLNSLLRRNNLDKRTA